MERKERLAEWLLRWEEATEQGRGTVLEDLCRDEPDLLSDFRRLLQHLGPVNAVLHGEALGATSVQELLARIDAGRFRPVSFHARGGLGLVFAAEDTELRRTVALKVLAGLAAADEGARRRFEFEAEVTAHLEHPGVVPVYGLGKDAQGKPYYAMRFIRGRTLAEALRAYHAAPTHIEFRRLLQSLVAVCETVAYAHARGVIHRDLKPDNIMLGPYGETLVLDWGLAKCLDGAGPAEIEDSFLGPLRLETRGSPSVQGRAKGTWGYMSPEQARGEWDRVGKASDVFSLGATLYVLLTGHKPFEGTGDELTERVKAGHFEPPRRRQPTVPQALDAICRKAMALRPEDRYADVQELAADLERWLADEPVSAWREPRSLRAGRWLRRHRSLVVAAVLALAVGSLVLAIDILRLREKNRLLQTQKQQLEAANADLAASQRTARENFDLADRAVRGTNSIINLRPSGGGAPDPLHKALHTEARDYYRLFIERNAGRAEHAFDVAFAYLKQAEAEIGLGNDDAAPPLLEQARARFAGLLSATPADPEARCGTACVDLVEGQLRLRQLRLRDAESLGLRAGAALKELCTEAPPALVRFEGIDAPSARLAVVCLLLRDAAVACDPRDPAAFPRPAAHAQQRLLPSLQLAEKGLLADLARQPETPPEALGLLAHLRIVQGEELVLAGKPEEGKRAYLRAREDLRGIVQKFPAHYELAAMANYVDLQLAVGLRSEGKLAEAQRQLEGARNRVRELANRPWASDEFGLRARTWLLLARCEKALGDFALEKESNEALLHYREALHALDQVAAEPGRADVVVRIQATEVNFETAETLIVHVLDNPLARQALQRVRGQMQALAPYIGEAEWFLCGQAMVDSLLGGLKVAAGEDGLDLIERGLAGLDAYLRQYPGDGRALIYRALAQANRGMALAMLKSQVDEGFKEVRAARAIYARMVATGNRVHWAQDMDRHMRTMLAALHGLAGEQLLQKGQREQARDQFEMGGKLMRELEQSAALTPQQKQVRDGLQKLKAQAD